MCYVSLFQDLNMYQPIKCTNRSLFYTSIPQCFQHKTCSKWTCTKRSPVYLCTDTKLARQLFYFSSKAEEAFRSPSHTAPVIARWTPWEASPWPATASTCSRAGAPTVRSSATSSWHSRYVKRVDQFQSSLVPDEFLSPRLPWWSPELLSEVPSSLVPKYLSHEFLSPEFLSEVPSSLVKFRVP